MDIVSYALSKKIAEHAVSGVQSMSVEGQNLIINTKDSGVLTMTFPTPKDGVSVADIDVNANNQIVFTMSDGTEFISGKIPTVKGDAGFSPIITENVDNTDKIYKLDITTADSTFTTPNLKGGAGGSGEENKIDSISVNGVNIVPDENKNVDITVPTVTNDLTDELKSSYDDAVTEKHTHDNKTVLDNITVEKVESWNKAEENVQSDWNETDNTADGFIKNKPTIPDAYDDTALSGRVDDVETSIGDMSLIEIKSVSDLVSAINVLYNAFMSSITYADKKLTITYRNGGTVDIDMSAIITDTNIGELSNIDDTGITDKQVLSYDTATNKYIPTTIDTAGVLADAKKYTDDEIAKINNADAISVDEKPTYSNGTITYKKDGVEKTITDGDFWFFYTVDDMAYQTIWIDGVEFTTSVDGSVDFKDFVSKTNDLTSTYTGEETDKTKVTTIASLDALYAIISTALGKKVNTEDIVDSLISDATNKPLSAAQGKALDTKISNFVTTIEEDYAKTADIPTTLPANGGNSNTVNNHTVETDVPVDAVFTDTIYDDTEVKGNIEELNSNLDDLSYGEFSGNDNICDIETNYNFPINIVKVTQIRQVYTKNIPQTSGYFYAYISANLTEYKSGTIAYYIDENDAQKYIGQEHIVNKSYRLPTSIKEFGLLNYGSHEGTISGIMFSETPITSYEPYIPSVKMLEDEVNAQNSNLDQLSYSENSINGNIVNGTNLIGTAVREGSSALADSVVVPSGSNTISTVYFTDGTKSTLNFGFSDGSVALPNPTTSDFTVSHVYFNSIHVGKIIKNIQLEIGTTTKGELYYVSSNNKLTKEIHKLNESLSVIGKCKNLLNPTLQTTTQNGVTCTNNGDGTYTLNGTATANTQFEIKARGVISKQIRLVGCPMGGSNTSYNIVVVNYNGSDIRDNGNGITIPTNTECAIRIYVGNGTTLSNKVFKPMLTTNDSVTYDDFVPYTGEGETLTADVAELKNDLVLQGLSNMNDGTWMQGITNSEGEILPSTTAVTTNKKNCSSGDLITVKTEKTFEWFVVTCVDSSGIVTLRKNNSGNLNINEFSVTAPANTVGFYISLQTTNTSVTPQNVGNVFICVNNAIDEIKKNLDTLEFGEVAGGKNLFNKETAHIGKVILFSSGEMITNADYFCTDYIPVIPNTTYVRSAFTTLGENWYYDIDKNPLNSIQENENIFTTPENAYYVRLSGGIPNVDIAQLEEGSVATAYEPYIPSVKMLADEVNAQNESLSVIGKCKNLLNPTLQTTTLNGVTCTNNGDGTYTLNGTASGLTTFILRDMKLDSSLSYKLTGCPLGGDWDNGYSMYVEKQYWGIDIGKGYEITLTDASNLCGVYIRITKDTVCNNLLFKPMITTNLNATYDDFVPYTGDGETLTHDVAEIKNDLGDRKMHFLKYTGEADAVIDIANYSDGLYLFTCAYASGNLPKNIFALVMVNNGMAGIVLKDSKDHSISEKKLTFKTDWYSNVFVTKVG